jgi:hexosaminidase
MHKSRSTVDWPRWIIAAIALAEAVVGHAINAGESSPASLSLVPQPAKVTLSAGSYMLSTASRIVADATACDTSRYLAESLQPSLGARLATDSSTAVAASRPIILKIDSALTRLGKEGYQLNITPSRVEMAAADNAGLFYACQTFRQLMPPPSAGGTATRSLAIPCVQIEDSPRFAWRGLMLDPARYFLDKALLKRYIDLLAMHKMNRLQLHLTDAENWTIEIRRYPQLTKRTENVYRQDDIRELVRYAAARHVLLVPEIESPGHSSIPGTVLRQHILCRNNPYLLPNASGKPAADKIWQWIEPCVANPGAFEFYRNVLDEVMDLFGSPYVHLGGDEYFGLAWETCPDCRALLEKENLRQLDTPELRRLFASCLGSKEKYLLYRYWMARLCDHVRCKGRQPILWDDLAWRGKFPAGAIIMQWHYKNGHDYWQNVTTPENPAVEAALAGHAAITVPFSHLYFDLKPSLETVYRFEPMPDSLPAGQRELILGPHAAAWAQPAAQLDKAVFPQLYALAELGWSQRERRNWSTFAPRCENHRRKMSQTSQK